MFSRYCSCYPLALPTIWCNLQYCYVVRVQGSIKKFVRKENHVAHIVLMEGYLFLED